MGVYLAEQTVFFLQSIIAGVVLGLLFDAFRISRIALPTPAAIVFVEDLLFFVVCALVTFTLLLGTTEGQVRVFLIVGEGLGAILYSMTLGRLVMAVSKTIIRIIKAILHFIFRWVVCPIWKIFYFLLHFLLRPFYFLAGTWKKVAQRWKFSLKVKRILVYNHFKTHLPRRKKISGETILDEKAEEAT